MSGQEAKDSEVEELRRDFAHTLNWANANDISQGRLIDKLIEHVAARQPQGAVGEGAKYFQAVMATINDGYVNFINGGCDDKQGIAKMLENTALILAEREAEAEAMARAEGIKDVIDHAAKCTGWPCATCIGFRDEALAALTEKKQ